MNFSIIFYILGHVLRLEGIAMLLPALVGLIYGEGDGWAFLICAGITLIPGLLLSRKPKNQQFYAKEGFVAVALSWLMLSLFGCIPFIMNGDIPRFADAFFETVSGFTTTGSTVLTDVEALSHASLFWRSFSHWLGGMGVLVFLLTILPLTGGSTMHLMRAESTGPQVGKIVPKIKDTSKILYFIYTVLTLIEILALALCRMPFFDAVTLSLGSAGTGGFAIRNTGLADYSAVCQYIIAGFVVLFGINFNVYFLLLRRRLREASRHEEARWYLGIIAVATLLIFVNTLKVFPTAELAFRNALFHVGSLITSTGYAISDYNLLYPTFSKVVAIILMTVGACAGSTGGGIKVSRIVTLGKTVFNECSRIIHPRTVKKVRMEGKVLDHGTIRSINTYMAAFSVIFFCSLLIVSWDGMDFTTNFTGVLATLNNIGPGLNVVGPMGNFSGFSDLSKYVFCFDMLAGRLELFPLLLLLAPGTWKQAFKKSKEIQKEI